VVGVAREVAALTGQSLRLPDPIVPEAGEPGEGQTSVEILDPDLCHRYAARVVRGIRLGPSPLWMRQRLQASGVRPINNVVDVTNYVLLELGHPLHAFDLHRLAGERIVVRRAGDGEPFTTLDGQDTLVICDGERPVAVAGIMGGLNSEVQEDTVDLLLESAYFEPRNIRRSSKRIGLQTEASYRFERGTDIEGLIRALDRSAELIVELAGGTVARGIWDAYPTAHERRRVVLRLGKVTSVLGVAVPQTEVHRYLTALGVRASEPSNDQVECEIPPHRVDLEREIDLIEEVARLYGYDAVPATVPSVAMRCEPYPAPLRLADAARDALQAWGFQEAVSLSFIDPDEDDRLGYPEDAPLRAKVSLENPLNRETGVLRTSLLPGLLRGAGLNARRQARDVRLFEVGRTYHPVAGEKLPTEVLRVGGILTGRRQPLSWWVAEEVVDFYDAKGAVEDFVGRLGIAGCRFAAAPDLPWLHPGRGARLSVGGAECGWVGELHPDRLGAYEIPPPAMAFELDLDALARVAEEPGPFTGLGKFPAVERDVALLLDRAVPAEAVLEAIDSLASPLIRSAVLFDAFEGGRIPPGKVSLAFRITYRTDERTLTEAEVMEVEKTLLRRLEERVGASLRTE
jgi:phenylalanyl-tRNA synthetase beta chain